MTLQRLDGLPMNRRRFLGGPGLVFERRNTDPDSQGDARRTGSQRMWTSLPNGLGVSAYPGRSSYVLLDDQTQSELQDVFEVDGTGDGQNWTVNLHLLPGALSTDSTDAKDVTLFRWGGKSGQTGSVELLFRTSAATWSLIAILTFVGGSVTLTYNFTTRPAPLTAYMVSLLASGANIAIYLDGTSVATGTLAAASRTITAGHWGETTILGRTARATAATNGEPKGLFPSITDFSVWDKAINFASSPEAVAGARLTTAAQASANLIVYLPLSDGGKDDDYGITAETKGSTRAYLCPGPPAVENADTTTDGVLFSGVGGHIRIPYVSEFDPFFTRRTELSSAGEWSTCVIVRTPEGVMSYPDGTATVVSWGPNGSLLKLEIYNSAGTTWNFRATVGTLSGAVTVNSTKALSAATRYVVFVSREDAKLALVVLDDSTTTLTSGALATAYGPEIDEGDVPEITIGAEYATATETWSQRWRGQIKHFFLWPHTAPLPVFNSGAVGIRDDTSLLAFNWKSVKGDFTPNLGTANAVSILERDSIAGIEGSPPYWTDGPIRDGEFMAAGAGIAFTATTALYPSDGALDDPVPYSMRAKGALTQGIGTDATIARFGNKLIVASNGRAHILDEDTQRFRPLGVPLPVARPGQISSSRGPVHGVRCYGLAYRTKDGTESGLKVLPPQAYRESTVAIGGGEGIPGSKYGEGNPDSSGTPGYFALYDSFPSPGAAHYSNTYQNGEWFFEQKCRLDPALLASDFREQVFDRGSDGSSSAAWTNFYGIEPAGGPGDIDPREPWTLQIVLRPTGLPVTDTNRQILAAISGAGSTNASDPTDPVILLADGETTGSLTYLAIAVSDGNQITNGWTITRFSTTLTDDTDYNIVIVFDGDNFNAFVNGTKDATTVTDLPHAQRNEIFRLGAGTTRAEAATYLPGTTVKANKQTRFYGLRFWERALPDSDIAFTDYVWFDPVEEARMSESLMRDYKFAKDDPFDKRSRFFCRISSEEMNFYRNNSGANGPDRARGTPYWFPDAKSGRVFTMLTSTATTPFSSAFQIVWSRIGNGSLIITSGDSLYYYAANQALVPGTPSLPADPQTWNWFGWWATTTDGLTTTPDITVNEVWFNGVRIYAGGVTQAREVGVGYVTDSADLCGWRDYPSGYSAVDVHLQEFRGWNSRKYVKEADFVYLLRRVPENEWSSMIYYYRMFSTTDAGKVDNDRLDTGAEDAGLVLNGDAALTTVSTAGLPTPPWPDISHIVFYGSQVYPVSNYDDEDELDRLKRAARLGPFYKLGEVPVGTQMFLDGASPAVAALGLPALPEDMRAPLYVTAAATWGGTPVLVGLPDMLLYVADPNDYESYLPSNYIQVPAADFSKVVAIQEAGDAFFVFGTSGGLIYRGNIPSRQNPTPIGGGVGAATARCVAAHGATCYVFGRAGLFAVGSDGQTVDLGRTVQDMLPSDPEQARLAIIEDSLYLIDEQDGDALRLHLPSLRALEAGGVAGWSFEDRALRGGMVRDDDVFYVHRSGFLAKGRTGYTDDTVSGQDTTGTATGGSSTTLVDSGGTFPTTGNGAKGQYVLLIRAADASSEKQQVTSNTATTLTVAGWTGTAPVTGDTWILGGYEMLVDTGWFLLEDGTLELKRLEVVRSSGTLQVGYQASHDASAPLTNTGVLFTSFTTSGSLSTNEVARYLRYALRSRTNAAAEAVGVFADLERIPITIATSPNA